jgi:putative FmdB family regulatory protein
MPLFEYECRDCGRTFEAFVTADRTAGCPACQGTNLTKLLSSPGMVGRSGDSRSARSLPMSGGCGAGGEGCACRAGTSAN